MRELACRYVVETDLRLESPLHVGGAASDVRSDMPLAEDGQGRVYIPGTSLAGALRAWAVAPADEDTYPWGPRPGKRGDPRDDENDQASHVFVEDAVLPEHVAREIRDHVGIARDLGTAATGIKFDRVILPRGTRIPLRMVWEVPRHRDRDREIAFDEGEAAAKLQALLAALRDGAVRFGAARSRGLGRVKLDGTISIKKQDLVSAGGIVAMLCGKGEALAWKPEDWPATDTKTMDVEIVWHPVGPVMVKAGEDGLAVDALPLVSGDGERLSLVLPGSALKGALRAQAERILRTIVGRPAPAPEGNSNRFLAQLGHGDKDWERRLELAQWLFGAPGEAKRDSAAPAQTKKELGVGLGALWVDDVYLHRSFEREAWSGVVAPPQAETAAPPPSLTQALGQIEKASGVMLDPAFHVAVDRWTGGAAEGLLFSTLEPHAKNEAAWEPIRLTFRIDRLRKPDRLAAFGLLLLVLRDVQEGLVPVGFAGNRGMGAIHIDRLKFRGLAALGGPADCEIGAPKELPEAFRTAVGNAWRAHASELRERETKNA